MYDRDCNLLTCHQHTPLECLGSFDGRMHVEHCRFLEGKKHTTEFCPPSVYSKVIWTYLR